MTVEQLKQEYAEAVEALERSYSECCSVDARCEIEEKIIALTDSYRRQIFDLNFKDATVHTIFNSALDIAEEDIVSYYNYLMESLETTPISFLLPLLEIEENKEKDGDEEKTVKTFKLKREYILEVINRDLECHFEFIEMTDRRLLRELIRDIDITLAESPLVTGTRYRTVNTVESNVISEYPTVIGLPSLKDFNCNALKFKDAGFLHLMKLKGAKELNFKDGVLYIADQPATKATLKDMTTQEGITDIDISFLNAIYGLLRYVYELDGVISDVHVVYLPDFIKYRGVKSNGNKKKFDAVIEKFQSFSQVGGFVKVPGKSQESIYKVLAFLEFNAKDNTLKFSSPYINHALKVTKYYSIKRDENGQPLMRKDGKPQTIPTHQYLTLNSLFMARKNDCAKVVVEYVARNIKARGTSKKDEITEISFSVERIINEDPYLRQMYEKQVNKTTWLRRLKNDVDTYLREDTILSEKYQNIRIWFSQDYPTEKRLGSLNINVSHEGEIKDVSKVNK